VPAIALSGYGTTADVCRSQAAGFQRHLVKPIDLRELLRAIDEVRLSATDAVHGPRGRMADRGFVAGARRRPRRLSPVA
jgi:DNA-binding response OmpR family regulator